MRLTDNKKYRNLRAQKEKYTARDRREDTSRQVARNCKSRVARGGASAVKYYPKILWFPRCGAARMMIPAV